MLNINISILIIGAIFYYLAYQSPKTDKILYTFSGFFFLVAAITGFLGYGDINIAETITYTYTTFNNDTVINTELHSLVPSGSKIFSVYLPLLEFLAGLYILIVFATENKNENRKQS